MPGDTGAGDTDSDAGAGADADAHGPYMFFAPMPFAKPSDARGFVFADNGSGMTRPVDHRWDEESESWVEVDDQVGHVMS